MNLPVWRHYSKFYRGSYGILVFSLFLAIVELVLVFPVIYLVGYAFDKVLPAGHFSLLLWIGIGMLGLTLANSAANLWVRYLTLKVTKQAIRDYRDELLNRIFAFSRSFYGEMDSARLHSIIVQDTERVDIMSNALLSQVIPALIVSTGVGLLLLYLNWSLFLILLILTPLLYFVGKRLGKKVRERTRIFHRSFEAFSKGILFVLESMDLTRIQTAEEFELQRQRRQFDEVQMTSGSMAWLQTAYGLLQNTILAVAGVLILIIGGRAVGLKTMSIGNLLSYYVAIGLLRTYLNPAFYMAPHVIAGAQSLENLHRIMHVEDRPPYSGRRRIEFSGGIELESVSFQYNSTPVLQDVDLVLPPHQSVAVVGPNGAGKSTIVYLLLGFYRPQRGRILIDGHSLDELDTTFLRRQIGVVPQQTNIFGGTVWENITYGAGDVSESQVVDAARLATAHEFIQHFPRGYDTLVGDQGMTLSGGQRQRIAIARALLRLPRLLILDEPTNHLDVAAVNELISNLKHLIPIPTILLISHDAKVTQEASCIYRMSEGRILSREDSKTMVQGEGIPARRP